jgi:hypothetical protein
VFGFPEVDLLCLDRICGVVFLVVTFEKEIPLSKGLVTEFGISEKEKEKEMVYGEPVSNQPVVNVDRN